MSRHWLPVQSTVELGIDGLKIDDVKDDSLIVSARRHVDFDFGVPVVEPIYHTATYRVASTQQYQDVYTKGGYMYLRYNNPTCEAAEMTINLMDRGAGSLVFGSGMAAITTALMTFLKPGDHMIACNPLYGGTHEYLAKILPAQCNVEVTFIDGYAIEDYEKACRPNTKVLYGESPSNPLVSIMELERFGALGQRLRDKGQEVRTFLDITFASSYLCKPIKYGVDIVIQSATKYLGGHSDLCAGVVTTRMVEDWKKLVVARRIYGGVLAPHDASLLQRGMKTIHVRVPRQSSNALILAEFLEAHPMVERVNYPGLKSHPGHEIAKREMKMFGGMITFEVKGGTEPAKLFVETLRIIHLAVSLGGVESLIEHPASMSHGPLIISAEERRKTGITDGLIRFSVGIEDPEDLQKDLEQALEKAASALK